MKHKVKKQMKRIAMIGGTLGLLICNITTMTGCKFINTKKIYDKENASTSSPITKEVFAMDTYMTLTAYGDRAEEAVSKAVEEIQRIELLVSTGLEDSEIAAINQNGSAQVSEDTLFLIEKSLELYESTEGAFDISIYPVMEEWGFTTGDYQLPEKGRLLELLKNVDASKITINGSVVTLEEGMKIDLGGIAKGYTSARIMEIFKEYGVEQAIVSLGGNVQTLGAKQEKEGWKVAVENPNDTSDYLGVLEIADKAVITSGGYKRYFEEDGKHYHHIIDPATGYPAESGLISVTIISEDGTLADGLSTSLFVMGKEKAVAYWKENTELFDFVLEEEDGSIYVSEGAAQQFSSNYEVTIITKQ